MYNPNEMNNRNEQEFSGTNQTPEETRSASDAAYTQDTGAAREDTSAWSAAGRETGNGPSYREANYTPLDDNSPVIPQYYYNRTERTEREEKKRSEKKRSFGAAQVVALCLSCIILGGAAGGFAGYLGGSGGNDGESTAAVLPTEEPDSTETETPVTTNTPVLTTSNSSGDAMDPADLYELACQQAVGIRTEVTGTNIFGQTVSSAVSGTGFIVSSDGYIVTNFHVIETAYEGGYDVNVILHDGQSYTAEIVGVEEDNDLAVLKIEATGLNAVTLGDSDELRVGDTVYAVGNPLGELTYTMTTGIVSALDREITTDASTTINMFQMDAAVNSGNSGGPVYNSQGEVVGIVTAKYEDTGVEGLSFAIPINDAVTIVNELIQNGYVTGKAYMGVNIDTYFNNFASYYNMPEGAYVDGVESGSCAETAGLQAGDIITAVGDTQVTNYDSLSSALNDYRAGDTTTLTVYRSGETLTLTITFDEEVPTSSSTDNSTQQQQQLPQYSQGFPYAG